MTILKLLADLRKQPFLVPIAREDYIVASIGVRSIEPRSKAAFGEMHAFRLHVEDKIEALVRKPICEFNIFGAAKALVETADSQNVASSK
jgi:hypothetical protein